MVVGENKEERMTDLEVVARRLGRMAFLAGMARASALDAHLIRVANPEHHTVRMRMMRAWYKGWDTANLEDLV